MKPISPAKILDSLLNTSHSLLSYTCSHLLLTIILMYFCVFNFTRFHKYVRPCICAFLPSFIMYSRLRHVASLRIPTRTFFYFFFIIVVLGLHCDIYKSKFLQYIIVAFITSIILHYPRSPISGIVSIGLIVPFT
jgi:hypothetical protein